MDPSHLVQLRVDLDEVVAQQRRKPLTRHLEAATDLPVQVLRELHPLRHHRVAVGEAMEVVVLEPVHVLPHHVAVPVDLTQRRVVAAETRHVPFERRRRLRRLVGRRVGEVDVLSGHQQVAVGQQTPVTRPDVLEAPAMHDAPVDVDQVRARVAVRREQRVPLRGRSRAVEGEPGRAIDGPTHARTSSRSRRTAGVYAAVRRSPPEFRAGASTAVRSRRSSRGHIRATRLDRCLPGCSCRGSRSDRHLRGIP